MSENRTRRVRKENTPVSENRTHKTNGTHSATKKTVNGPGKKNKKSVLRTLPDLKQPESQTKFIVDEILSRYGDQHSKRHYRLVAAKIPYEVIQRVMSEIKNDGGAEHPARVFTTRMERYAEKRLESMKTSIGAIGG